MRRSPRSLPEEGGRTVNGAIVLLNLIQYLDREGTLVIRGQSETDWIGVFRG